MKENFSLLDRVWGGTLIKVYHGTSSIYIPKIRAEGLKAGDPERREAWGLSVSTRKEEALIFAKEKAEEIGGTPVIIETKVPRGMLMVNRESLAAYPKEHEREISAARIKGGHWPPSLLFITENN